MYEVIVRLKSRAVGLSASRPFTWTAIAVALAGMAFSPHAADALSTCPAAISACCTISKPGKYTVSGPLTSSGGDCIDVAASRVTLNLNDANITGTSNGVGIHLLSTATKAIVVGGDGTGATISKFSTGLQTDAPQSYLELIEVEDSSGDGIVNNGTGVTLADIYEFASGGRGLVDNANGLALLGFFASANGSDGIVINSSNNIRFDSVFSDGNTGNGIVLQKVRNAVISASEAGSSKSNGLNGVLISAGGNNSFNELDTNNNQQNGVLVENSSGNSFNELTASENQADGVSVQTSSSNQFSNCIANNNHLNGFELDGSSNNGLETVVAASNIGSGVWLNGSAANTLMYFTTSTNGTSGIYIGCSATTEPSGMACSSLPPSNNNFLSDGTSENNAVGIGIDLNNHSNRMIDNSVSGNTSDLADSNPACNTDVWEPEAPTGCAH
jgi:parallel beta-helix repeat protein